ncbi:MAG: peptidoglycan-binding protein [Vicinamibacterales bacterium]
MSRTLFGRGAQGALIEDLQRGLVGQGIPLGKVDGNFGRNTEEAIRAFQARSGSTPTGSVDVDEWTALTGKPLPALAERCLQITAAFEGHNYTVAAGNWDGAWLTWGIIGFTMAAGSVQGLFRSVEAMAPQRVADAFGTDATAVREIMRAVRGEQRSWALSLGSADGHRLIEPWQTAFARFGGFPEVQAAQRQSAFDNYFTPALRTASELGVNTELGIALCFDTHVQNGGVSPDARRDLPPFDPTEPERVRRIAIANAVADHSRTKFRENVRSRKLAIATGAGAANGVHVVAADWGLAEVPATV